MFAAANLLAAGTALVLPVSSPVRAAVSVVGLILMTTGLVLQTRHRSGAPCTTCGEAIPLNGSEEATRRRWRWSFALLHRCVWTVPGTAVLIVGMMSAGLLLAEPFQRGVGIDLPGRLTDLLLALALLTSAAVTWAVRVHGRLMPWCPYCRDDDGPGAEDGPAPAPQDGHGRPVRA
ncbi:hypothetical protein ABZ615_31825 [Streptomyces sp. NPDC007325]|uniref:hypothetical protein n=1 Tax=Streptomyces sp. NPDC007325 TaxID=3154588 RepID=UPI0033C6B780